MFSNVCNQNRQSASPDAVQQDLSPFRLSVLNFQGVEAFLQLHSAATLALPEHEKYFLKSLTAQDVAPYAQDPQKGLLLGTFAPCGTLAGGALVVFPAGRGQRLQEYMLETQDAVVQSVITHPSYQRLKLARYVVQHASCLAAKQAHALVAKVAVNNLASQNLFLGLGFSCIKDDYHDVRGGYKAGFWKKNLHILKTESAS